MNQNTTEPSTIQAAHYTGAQTIVVEEHPLEGPEPGEVTIAVSTCGVCGSDLHFYAGRWSQPQCSPGHEITGVVAAIGAGVEGWAPGDRVVVDPIVPCGRCVFCQRGEINRCMDMKFISVHRDGGFTSAFSAPASCLLRVPQTVSESVAALVEPLAVGVRACRVGGIAQGDTVVVCGAGSIGLLAIVAAREAGARQVLCSARHPQQKEAAERLGAQAIASEEMEEAVKAATEGVGADVVLETIGGAGQVVGQALSVVRSGGAIVLVGGFTRPTSIHLGRVVGREIRILGTSCYSRSQKPTDFELALSIAASGKYPLETLVTHQFPLADIAEAFKTALDKSSGAIKVQVGCESQVGNVGVQPSVV